MFGNRRELADVVRLVVGDSFQVRFLGSEVLCGEVRSFVMIFVEALVWYSVVLFLCGWLAIGIFV